MASKKYSSIKTYYALGSWSKETVKKAVVKGWITEEEYESITGEAYEA